MGYDVMYRIASLILTVAILILLLGCQARLSSTMTEEVSSFDTDAADTAREVFIFAESPFLDIDSDMMAEQFQLNKIPAAIKTIDSITAWDAVYNMLLDSLMAADTKDFDLRAHDTSLYIQFVERRQDRILRLLFVNEIRSKVNIADSVVRHIYETEQENFTVPKKYRARHIVLAGHALKKEDSLKYRGYNDEQMDSIAFDMITDLRQRILDGANFDTLAMLYSQDPRTKAAGGDLGYFQLASMAHPFDSTVEHTPIGELSGIIKTVYGWHILRVEDMSPGHVRPYDSVVTEIKERLEATAMQTAARAFADSVSALGTVVVDTAALNIPDSLLNKEDPVAYVNPDDLEYGCDTIVARQYIEQLYPYKRARNIQDELSFEEKERLMNLVAVRFHLLRAARILGYADSEDMRQWSERLYKRYCVSIMQRQFFDDSYEPTQEEVEAYYKTHMENYVSDRPVYVQHIIFADSNLAEHVRDQLESGADFMEMVDLYYPGDPEIKRAAADLGYIGENDMPRAFWNVAMTTAPGKISAPVKTEYGYHIIKVVEKQFSVDLAKASFTIRSTLKEQHKRQMIVDFVVSQLGQMPKIHWDRRTDLYRKEIPRPTGMFNQG